MQIYIYPKAAIYTYDEYKNKFRSVFEYNLKHINDKNSDINKIFLIQRSKEYLANTSNERKVIDYIAGMTDDFFLEEYRKYVLKQQEIYKFPTEDHSHISEKLVRIKQMLTAYAKFYKSSKINEDRVKNKTILSKK